MEEWWNMCISRDFLFWYLFLFLCLRRHNSIVKVPYQMSLSFVPCYIEDDTVGIL